MKINQILPKNLGGDEWYNNFENLSTNMFEVNRWLEPYVLKLARFLGEKGAKRLPTYSTNIKRRDILPFTKE